jgi:hypothetical protein
MADKGEIHRFPRTFRLRQSTIDGLLTLAEFAKIDATAALEMAIAAAAAKLYDRERVKLTILAAHCWRAGVIAPERFRELLDFMHTATAQEMRDERRAILGLLRGAPCVSLALLTRAERAQFHQMRSTSHPSEIRGLK